MNLVLVILFSYFIGSFPTAYVFSRLFYKSDIREKGSGNVGTLNFLRVNGSKIVAIFVLVIDIGKGYLTLWIASQIINLDLLILPSLFVLLGHIYPVWLKGKGGRGMATIAGIFLFLQPLAVAVWCVIFAIVYLLTKKYILGGIAALLLVNIYIAIFLTLQIFLISSASSLLVMLQYLPRLKEELSTS